MKLQIQDFQTTEILMKTATVNLQMFTSIVLISATGNLVLSDTNLYKIN